MQRVGESSIAITKAAIEQSMKQMQPVREISLAITAAAVVVRDALKQFTKREPPDEEAGVSIEIAVFYESIYFLGVKSEMQEVVNGGFRWAFGSRDVFGGDRSGVVGLW